MFPDAKEVPAYLTVGTVLKNQWKGLVGLEMCGKLQPQTVAL